MSLRLCCYNGGIKGNDFLPLLRIIEKYPFPKPRNCSRTNPKLHWLNTTIHSFTDPKFIKYLDPLKRNPNMHIVSVDENSDLHITLSIAQKEDSVLLLSNAPTFINIQQLKQLFIELIECNALWSEGHYTSGIAALLQKNFPNERRTKTMLTWLQYYGKAELEWRGGFAAFESNPYVQTQRIHDGLLVQVGDSPDGFDTPEGEQLLVNAINALPPLKS